MYSHHIEQEREGRINPRLKILQRYKGELRPDCGRLELQKYQSILQERRGLLCYYRSSQPDVRLFIFGEKRTGLYQSTKHYSLYGTTTVMIQFASHQYCGTRGWYFFCTIAVFSLCGEYVVRSFLPNGVFLPCDHGLDF